MFNFYVKLAFRNIRQNKRMMAPYVITCICTIALFYMFCTIATSEEIGKMSGGSSLSPMLGFGTVIAAIFSVIFLFYTNSFLIKSRKKELGLYNILGLEKRHIAKMMLFETVITGVISLAAGLTAGLLFTRLMFLILLKIVHFTVPPFTAWSLFTVRTAAGLFSGIFALTFLWNLGQVHLANPIELLRGGSVGEKEPKTKVILAATGFLCLGIAYYIALTTQSPLEVIGLFFVAVLLVVIGTYALFTAGSIAFLKALRKNKSFYYKPNHFISVSGMIYRMKQNAAGLSSICILSTAVIVMISATLALYIGNEDALRGRFPQDVAVYAYDSQPEDRQIIDEMVSSVATEFNISLQQEMAYSYYSISSERDGDFFNTNDVEYDMNTFSFLVLMDEGAFLASTGLQVDVAPGKAVVLPPEGRDMGDTIQIMDVVLNVQTVDPLFLAEARGNLSNDMDFYSYSIVLKDWDSVVQLVEAITPPEDRAGAITHVGYSAEGEDVEIIRFHHDLNSVLNETVPRFRTECLQTSRGAFLVQHGGLLFLGIFLGMLFLVAAVLIIYYKQVTEGYEDKQRFEIMRNVGLSQEETKKTIRSQILTIFFLPLLFAVIHMAFGFKVITRLLALFNLKNVPLFFFCTVGTILVFGLIYTLVYILTAKIYYRIIN